MEDRDYDNDELETPKWKCKQCGLGSDDCDCVDPDEWKSLRENPRAYIRKKIKAENELSKYKKKMQRIDLKSRLRVKDQEDYKRGRYLFSSQYLDKKRK